jgi:N-methylhydantoinase B/oxoprolinase/acetone carboxylase alpha subunit
MSAAGHTGPLRVDPAALQVLIARLEGVAEEMGAVLQRSAFSPNIKERADCSAAAFDPMGRSLAQAEHIPVHLGSMPASVAAVIEVFGESLGAGEHAVVNDPFAGGTHLNDITVVTPCWAEGTLVGWVASRAHHADVGGAAPGSMPADATEIHQEGLRLPPVRLDDGVRALILANSRTPRERSGDLEAQLGANLVGAARMVELAGSPFEEVLAHGERRCRAVLGALAEGEYSAEDQLDSTGSDASQQRPARLCCAVRVERGSDGPSITFDFTGTDPQRAGNANAVEAVTVSAVGFVLRSVLDHTLPANAGTMAPVRVVAPAGSLVAAVFPAAVGAGNVEVSQRIVDVCRRAMAELVPERVGAGDQGTMNNLLVGSAGGSSAQPWVYYETVAGGQGGRPPDPSRTGAPPAPGMSGVHTAMTNTDQVDYRSAEPRPGQSGIHTAMTNTDQVDYRSAEPRPGQSGIHTAMTNTDQVDYRSAEPRPGQSGIHTAMTNTRNTPIEALERAFPLRVLRYRLRRGSGGAGWSAGGEGIERDLQVLEDATVSLITERRVSQPWGLAGGEPGAVGENWLLPGGDEARAERLPDKCTIRLRADDVLRMLTPGGGGWGTPRASNDL